MFLFPLPFLLTWLVGLLSLAVLGGGLYLVYAWYVGIVVGTAYLIGGLAMTLFSVLGRFLVLALLAPSRPNEPQMVRGGEVHRVPGADGTELQVEVYGPPDAPPLLLTHGWGLNSTEWYYAKQALAERFRLIVWDLRGLGESTRPTNGDYGLDRMAHDLRAVLDVAGGRPAVLVGHSIGTMVMQSFCRLFPDELGTRVAGLVLAQGTYTNPVRTALASGFLTAIQKPVIEPLNVITMALAPLVWLQNWLSYLNGTLHLIVKGLGFGGAETRGQIDFVARFQTLAWPGVTSRGTQAMLRFDETATLPRISVPTLIVAGDRDHLTEPRASVTLHEAIPDSKLVMLGPAGHMGLLEHHPQFAQEVAAFANRLPLSPTLSGRADPREARARSAH